MGWDTMHGIGNEWDTTWWELGSWPLGYHGMGYHEEWNVIQWDGTQWTKTSLHGSSQVSWWQRSPNRRSSYSLTGSRLDENEDSNQTAPCQPHSVDYLRGTTLHIYREDTYISQTGERVMTIADTSWTRCFAKKSENQSMQLFFKRCSQPSWTPIIK